jgi:hypothetical protein
VSSSAFASSSKLSTLASSKQLASPAPARKTASVFSQRTANIQAQVAVLHKSSVQQQQQLAAASSALAARPASAQSAQSLRSQSLSARAAALASSTAASSSGLLGRPSSAATAAVVTPAVPAVAHSSVLCTPVKRGVVWRDEDSSCLARGQAPGELEEVRFMSPATPERDAAHVGGDRAAPGASLSLLGIASLSQFAASRKPMPDLTKTPSKSCLRRTHVQQPTAVAAAPLSVALLSSVAATAAVADFGSAVAAPGGGGMASSAPQRIMSSSSTFSSSSGSSVQSGARRVPNLKPSGVVTSSGGISALSGALRTLNVQPQATGTLDKSSAAFLAKKPLSMGSAALHSLSGNATIR